MADLKNCKVYKNDQFEILTHDGFRDFQGIMRGSNNERVDFILSGGMKLSCTPKHKIMTSTTQWKYAKDLNVGDVVHGNNLIQNKLYRLSSDPVYEFLEIAGDHTYLVNNILCHQCLILDELAFIDPPSIMEDFWRSVWPTISRSKTSKVLIASTPNGTDNLFYQLYDGAAKGQNGFATMTIPWYQVPGRDEKWKQEQIKAIGSIEAFEQEFNCVFHHKGESSIDIETFEKLKKYCSDPEIMLDGESYKIWKSPEEDRIYIAGVDVAEGVGQNYSVIQILDVTDLTNIEQVAIYRDNAIAPAQFTVKLNEILTQWGKPLVLVERNSCGQIVVENLRANHNYENIVSYGAELAGRKKEFLGVIAHTNTKQRGVLNMRYWVNVLKCVKFNDMNTLIELKDFVRKPNGTWSARGNNTDDCVMALVWALVILDNDKQFGICNQYFEVEETDDNGKPSKLKPMDFGLTYFTKKDRLINSPGAWLEMMTAERYKDSATMPIAFGSTTSKDDDLADMELQGWEFL